MEEHGLEAVLTAMKKKFTEENHTFPVGDALHFGKHFRARLLKYLLMMEAMKRAGISAETIRRVTGLGAPITDNSQLGKMRDVHPLAIFRIENILALFNSGNYNGVVGLLPMTMFLNALRLQSWPSGRSRSADTNVLRISGGIVGSK
jgi:hypothetical protein